MDISAPRIVGTTMARTTRTMTIVDISFLVLLFLMFSTFFTSFYSFYLDFGNLSPSCPAAGIFPYWKMILSIILEISFPDMKSGQTVMFIL